MYHVYKKKKCLGALARAHIPLVAQAVWLLHADDGTTKLGPHPNKAVANCWFMTQKCQCQKAARVRLLRRYSYSTHSCDSKSRSIYFPSHVKKTVHHQPTLLHNKIPSPSACTVPTQLNSYSIMEGSLVSRIWSVRIQGMDISMGNWMRRPMVSSRKNSRNQSWDRSQHCCSASEMQEIPPRREGTRVTPTGKAAREVHMRQLLQPHIGLVLGMEHFSRVSLFLNPDYVHAVWALCNGKKKKGSFILL